LITRILPLGLILGFTPIIQLVAQDGEAKSEAWNPLVGILLMLGVFFFLIILPQSRKAKKQAALLSSLQKGDQVITQSGLYGKIYGIAERVVTLEIAPNVRIRIDRQSIAGKDSISGEGKK